MWHTPAVSRRRRFRDRAIATAVDTGARSLSRLGRLHPKARHSAHGVEVVANIPYGDEHRAQRLDLYCPTRTPGPWPVVFYVHGGGFSILSKDTHWAMALSFAARGYLVVNIDYRLAPEHRFPIPLQDVLLAYAWTLDHVAEYGGDAGRIVLAGESAGANLVLATTLATIHARPEPWANVLYERGRVPDAVLPACGILQVTNIDRFAQGDSTPSAFVMSRIVGVGRSYIGSAAHRSRAPEPGPLDFADPLVWIERGDVGSRSMPPVFAPVGGADPLLADTVRLEQALTGQGVRCEAPIYPGARHAFHALVWRSQARQCWRDTQRFLSDVLQRDGTPASPGGGYSPSR